MGDLKSKEAQFLRETFSHLPLPKHPILAVIVGQASKLAVIIDGNPELQVMARRILNHIRENWREDEMPYHLYENWRKKEDERRWTMTDEQRAKKLGDMKHGTDEMP